MAGTRIRYTNIWGSGGAKTDPGGVKIDLGWVAEKPPYQFQNFMNGRSEEMLAYIESTGVVEWNIATPYSVGATVMATSGLLYRCIGANTGQDPATTAGSPGYVSGFWKGMTNPGTEIAEGLLELATGAETISGASSDLAIHPAGLATLTATDARRGLVELATPAEAAALSDTTRAVTAEGLGNLIASTTAKGIVELATSAEVITGTDATRAVTPESIGSLAQSLGTPGYKTFPGGMILQWGQDNVNNTVSQDVTLPISFPTAFLLAIGSSALLTTGENDNDAGARPDPGDPLSSIRLSSGQANRNVHWLAIGH